MADGSHESGRGHNGSSGSPQPYIVIGHGIEDVAATKNNNFTAGRIQVPEGVTVVSLAQCGDSTHEDQVCPFLQLFTEEGRDVEAMLKDPAKHKKALERRTGAGELHIYKEGDWLPRFAVQYFAQMSDSIFKSGVYPYPIDTARLIPQERWGKEKGCEGFERKGTVEKGDRVDPALLGELFEQSVFPPPIELTAKITYKTLIAKLTRKFEDVFDALPKPAVYYYVICRAPFQSSGRTVYGKVPAPLGESLPGAFSVEKTTKVLALDPTFIAAEKAKEDEDESIYGGLDIAAYMKANPEKVPRELVELFESIQPIKTRNELAKFEDIDAKAKMVLAFPAASIKDRELREMFVDYQGNFKGWIYDDPANYIPKLRVRRRGSIAQQQKYRGEGGRRTRRKRRR